MNRNMTQKSKISDMLRHQGEELAVDKLKFHLEITEEENTPNILSHVEA
jgi:hypothetical protein